MHRFAPLALAAAAACGPQVIVPQDDGTTSDPMLPPSPATVSAGVGEPSSTSGPPDDDGGVTTLPPSADTSAGDESPLPPIDDGWDFIDTPDGGCLCSECDLFAQDCALGDKCMPWANDGGPYWNATRCSPVARKPGQLGAPCMVEGSEVSGIDDCDVGLMCLYVDPDTLQGTCVSMCTGNADAPICDEGLACGIDNDGTIVLCLPSCNPLLDDCDPGTCIPVDDDFVCFADGPAALPGEACGLPVDCAPGSTCLPAGTTGDCGVGNMHCCASFCDLSAPDPNATCLPGQTCTPWYRPGTVMPPLDAIGACLEPR
jgi:hypothetical protein